jgi:putative NADH-flavin reductase
VRVVVLGASGPTGRLVVARALEHGHQVTAVARHLDVLAETERLTLRPADVRDPLAVRAIVPGHEAAVSVIGTPARSPGNLYSTAARSLVGALEAEGVPRFVGVSSSGVRPDDCGLPLWFRLAIPLFLRELYRDMGEMERIVRTSRLDWTLVRAAYLIDKPARGRFRVVDGANPPGGSRISRADLADFLIDQLETDRWSRAAPTLAY